MRKGPVPEHVVSEGICSKKNGPDFFSPLPEDVRRAKNMCALCPVKFDCLQYAVSGEPETYGVWGGADQWEIRAACAVTPYGTPVRTPRPAKCPFCRSVKGVTEFRELNSRSSRAQCSLCGLSWRRAKSYVKKDRTRARSLDFTEIPDLPDAA